ncbi:MAG: tetratricopeptide repeat protein [gamma proteobacterium symbiont of Bathyaustriella thionipta]|nr:tetratricopeptide repeat protein [gamma proteobacterium symbiont of Bathyaustriella thionipta]MCU7954652.1 tetratricopeptide repeat protein [gamma proteobacterium symbiont of Bathyaustriella thionipta]MCU7956881.1 tetratricopeptide repeat protein [gamma proteobacterium symbiont of Bathyaustriella thionipta]MCU7966161.1 tetratricopeptide repeat protein [gamma proteobacterium symbiont of Bathyaustriella thionipta]
MILVISGCAINSEQAKLKEDALPAQTKNQTDQTPVNEKTASPEKPGKPAQALTAELLYDLMVAELALQCNDYPLAFDKYYEAAKATKDGRLAKKATRVTLFSKDDVQTFKAVKLWSELQPENIDVQQIYASSLISQKQDAQAITYLQKVINLSDSFESGFKRAVAIIDTIEEHNRATRIFNELAVGHTDKPLTKLYQAKLAFKFVDYPTTEKYLNELLALQPDYLDALTLKVDLLKKQNRELQAIQILEKIVHKLPENTGLRLELARLLVNNKHYEQGLGQIKQLAKKELAPEVLFAISLLAIEMDKLDEAKQYLERLHAHRLYASESAYFIGQFEAGRKNYAEAEIWFKQVRNGKYTFEAYLGLVMVYAQQKKFEQAFKLLEHSSANNSKQSSEILQIKAKVYAQAENYTKAYDIYTEALALAPDNHDILYGRAMLAEKFGRIDLLEKDLHTILAANPKDNQALNALGYTLADRTTRYKEARKYIERALKINPEDVATLDSMGWVLYKMGEQAEALNYLKKAYDKDPDAEIAAHYGEVLWVTGQTKKAKFIWDKALKNDPEHRVLIGIMTRYLK